jgi:NADH-quinone oxidoreductase subunit K
MISIQAVLILCTLLFAIGLVGVISRRNIFIIYMSIELMLNAVNLAFVGLSRYFENLDGSIMTILIIATAAAEAALFLTIIILLFRLKNSVDVNLFTTLRRFDIFNARQKDID